MHPLEKDTVTPSQPIELVSLLDADGNEIGVADKYAVHTTDTPLHLAFSCHLFNAAGEVLVTRRALTKLTWPGVWTNSFCGHPAPGEPMDDAVRRRAAAELGVEIEGLELVLPDFRYRAVDASGIVENEVCPVYRATTRDVLRPNPAEVAEFEWVTPAALRTAVAATPFAFSPWIVLQLSAWS
jgi:isopentenyl-diphosphate Delta-isomerase